MTSATKPPINDRQKRLYGPDGRAIGSVTATRSQLEGALLAECERGHVYLLPRDVAWWMTAEASCPRCRVLGHC